MTPFATFVGAKEEMKNNTSFSWESLANNRVRDYQARTASGSTEGL